MFIKSSNPDMSAIRFKAYKEGHLLPVMQAEVMMDSFRYQALIKQLHDASGLDDASLITYTTIYCCLSHHVFNCYQGKPTGCWVGCLVRPLRVHP